MRIQPFIILPLFSLLLAVSIGCNQKGAALNNSEDPYAEHVLPGERVVATATGQTIVVKASNSDRPLTDQGTDPLAKAKVEHQLTKIRELIAVHKLSEAKLLLDGLKEPLSAEQERIVVSLKQKALTGTEQTTE